MLILRNNISEPLKRQTDLKEQHLNSQKMNEELRGIIRRILKILVWPLGLIALPYYLGVGLEHLIPKLHGNTTPHFGEIWASGFAAILIPSLIIIVLYIVLYFFLKYIIKGEVL